MIRLQSVLKLGNQDDLMLGNPMRKFIMNCALRCVGILSGGLIGAAFGGGSGVVWGGGGGGMAGAALFTLIGGAVGFFMIPDLKWLFRKLPMIGDWTIFRQN